MERAAEMIVGDHSFKAFAKAGQEERGDRCTVTEARWAPWEGIGLEFHITANRFLHHMVRYLVGTLVDIGLGQREPGGDAGAAVGRRGRRRRRPPRRPRACSSPPSPIRRMRG